MIRNLSVTNSFNEVRNFRLCDVIKAPGMSSCQSCALRFTPVLGQQAKGLAAVKILAWSEAY